MGRKRGGKSIVSVAVDFTASLFCAEDCVAEGLGGFVGKLASAERLQPRLSFVERTLGRRPETRKWR